MIDLRSDTVTRPTPAMRQAIASAEVGDDVYGEDPTVNELERVTADLLGKDAALFVPSGTMANQLAVRLHCQIGDEVILEAGSHIYGKEAGGAAALSGVSCRPVVGERGIFTADQLLANLAPPDVHHAPARLVCVENTHNGGGGSIWPIETLAELAEAARARGLSVHMDGARLWNAAVASGIAEREFTGHCDSVSVCFSKSLGAPVGSALAGSTAFIERGRRFRKQFGGGMRQAGLLAAGALFALRNHRERLADDHANARFFADLLHDAPGVELMPGPVETNIVRFRVPGRNAQDVVQRVQSRGAAMLAMGVDVIRVVTHFMLTCDDVETAARMVSDVMIELAGAGSRPAMRSAPVGSPA